jgi:hypothetical protein
MTQAAASVSGYVAPGFEVVQDAFAANFTRRDEVGAAFAAHVDGELVVDLARSRWRSQWRPTGRSSPPTARSR